MHCHLSPKRHVICTADAIILTCVSMQMKTSKDSENNILLTYFDTFKPKYFILLCWTAKAPYKYPLLSLVYWEPAWLQPPLNTVKATLPHTEFSFFSHCAKWELSTPSFCSSLYSSTGSNPRGRKGGIQHWKDHQVHLFAQVATMCKCLTGQAASDSQKPSPGCWKAEDFQWPLAAMLQPFVYLRCTRGVQGMQKSIDSKFICILELDTADDNVWHKATGVIGFIAQIWIKGQIIPSYTKNYRKQFKFK